ncbi:MAG: DUF3108 domain-containing protein [Sterolibacteriaceae bacterium MAG5]|nr:DUF3108 domain-containing protein [Candidatus Nitricoxidireducens bremensis]
MPFAIAFVVSAVLHAAAITMPGWELPGLTDPEPPPLEARLTAPPKAAAAPAPTEKAKPPTRPAPARKPAVPVVAAAAEATAAAAPAQESPAAVVSQEPPPAPAAEPSPPPSPAAPPAPPWPSQGRVRYVVTYGEGGFIIGENIHEWTVAGDRYSIRWTAEPRGLAALRGRTRTQESAGEVTAEGLRPREFRDQREGREAETAAFDWPASRVVFSGGRGEGELAPGAQDQISVFYQLAWLAPRRNLDLPVATASRIGRSTFEWLGEEEVDINGARLPSLHLRTRSGGDTTEVWLVPGHGGLPLKIRYIDRKGDVFDQVADMDSMSK